MQKLRKQSSVLCPPGQLCTTASITASVTELSVFHNQAFPATRFSAFKDVKYYDVKKNNRIVS